MKVSNGKKKHQQMHRYLPDTFHNALQDSSNSFILVPTYWFIQLSLLEFVRISFGHW